MTSEAKVLIPLSEYMGMKSRIETLEKKNRSFHQSSSSAMDGKGAAENPEIAQLRKKIDFLTHSIAQTGAGDLVPDNVPPSPIDPNQSVIPPAVPLFRQEVSQGGPATTPGAAPGGSGSHRSEVVRGQEIPWYFLDQYDK